jgi:hypothetical protein
MSEEINPYWPCRLAYKVLVPEDGSKPEQFTTLLALDCLHSL